MTPIIQSAVRLYAEAGQDPIKFQWFDATGCFSDMQEMDQAPLHTMRPPFGNCVVCWEGKTTKYAYQRLHMLTAGDDPEQGIFLSVSRFPYGGKPTTSPTLLYRIDGEQLKYGPLDEKEPVDPREAQMILGFMAAWLGSLSSRAEAYIPTVKPTFTNKRKIAQGKVPTYEWRTVMVGPAQIKREYRGGTHASPRLHDRRGHLRRLKSGKNVWVSSCKVGDASKGVVFHDYKLGVEA